MVNGKSDLVYSSRRMLTYCCCIVVIGVVKVGCRHGGRFRYHAGYVIGWSSVGEVSADDYSLSRLNSRALMLWMSYCLYVILDIFIFQGWLIPPFCDQNVCETCISPIWGDYVGMMGCLWCCVAYILCMRRLCPSVRRILRWWLEAAWCGETDGVRDIFYVGLRIYLGRAVYIGKQDDFFLLGSICWENASYL